MSTINLINFSHNPKKMMLIFIPILPKRKLTQSG